MTSEPAREVTLEEAACVLCDSREAEPIAQGYDYEYWATEQEYTVVRCRACGHVYLNPRPTSERAALMYPSDYYTLSGRHTRGKAWLIGTMKRLVVRGRLSGFGTILEGSGQVLEVGCGDCALLLDLKDRFPEVQATGVDLAFPDEVWERRDELGLTLIRGRIEDVPLPENMYDLVILNQLIEHLWDPAGVLKKISRSLRPGGMVSVETVNIGGYDRRFFAEGHWGGYYFPRHLNLFSFDSLSRLLGKAGLTTVKQYSLVAPIVWAFSAHAALCPSPAKRKRLVGRFFTDRNPLCLAVFTLVDLVAMTLGCTTSNQKTVAQKQV